MYFPIGWPKVLKVPPLENTQIKQVASNRDRILFAILTDDSLSIWFSKPCVPIVSHRRPKDSLAKFGTNEIVEWKPDSSKIVVVTSEGHLLFYSLNVISDQKGLYVQTDSPHANLRRDSAELFIKEIIPPLKLLISEESLLWDGKITSIVCITMTELMVATSNAHVLRYRWDGTQNRDYDLDLRRIPFCINQQVSKAVPIVEENTFIVEIEYSPLVGGFAVVFNDGRAAFLTASSLRFDPNQVQGIWAQGIEDATCASVNHKYRLITFGRQNSECIVYHVDETTGGLAVSHICQLSSKDYPGCPGPVGQMRWTPDGCAIVATWKNGGLAMWSTFGALLMCSLGWDYGLNVDILKENPLLIHSMEWGTEGYQLWMVRKEFNTASCDNKKDSNANDAATNADPTGTCDITEKDANFSTSLIQLDFVKSALTINPCMSHQSHLYLQGEDKLYINSADTLVKLFSERSSKEDHSVFVDSIPSANSLSEGRQWLVIPVPSTYSATNWPIRYSAIDQDGQNMAIAGRTGLAYYSLVSRRWKLFGNETQEKDFIISGGLLWWRDYIVLACYSIVDNGDEIRFYPKESKLDNKFARILRVSSPIMLINSLQDTLVTFGSDGIVSIWTTKQIDNVGNVDVLKLQEIDISALCVHPACIVSITLTNLRAESGREKNQNSESLVLNASGRLLLLQRDKSRNTCSMPTVLAGSVENVWVPGRRKADKVHLTEALWLFCGAHGMRVWLPLYPRDGDKSHTFMSKRIMLPFHLRIYPLAILFEDAIILGAENDTVLYTNDTNSPFSLPFCNLQRTSQVYLHQILRQLIRRNLGYHAWEIARSCTSLPYFPHSLELLLHEVLEEEATSKEPIPDAQLPSVIEFIMEFPVYLQTVVQCARKTEIALWPYLFSAAGKPKDLFQECMAHGFLDTAASYLIILQNLETSSVSRQHATLLLDTALNQSKWELAKDLVRFLRAIDPNDVDSPRNSMIKPNKLNISQPTPPVSPNAEDISLILGNVQRARSYSTTVTPKITDNKVGSLINNAVSDSPIVLRHKKSVPASATSRSETRDSNNSNTAEEFFIDVILQRHARRLLSQRKLIDLGYFAAHLDFHLVAWLGRERDRAARIDDFVAGLKHLHEDFAWPYPSTTGPGIQTTAQKSPESPNIDEKFKSLQLDINNQQGSSRIGDSGYISYPGLPYTGLQTPQNTFEFASQITEAPSEAESLVAKNDPLLTPKPMTSDKKIFLYEPLTRSNLQSYRLTETHLRTDDTLSTVSSMWADDRDYISNNCGSENWEVPSTQILEQLSSAGNKGSQRSEVQLRYLLQLFMEASCLEWSLLISVLLRDALAVLRTVNASKSPDQSIESVKRLKQGLQILHYWSDTECYSYKPFMLAILNQISVLSTILTTKIQNQQILEYQRVVTATLSKVSSPPITRSRKSSTNQDSTSSTAKADRLSVSSINDKVSDHPEFIDVEVETANQTPNSDDGRCIVS